MPRHHGRTSTRAPLPILGLFSILAVVGLASPTTVGATPTTSYGPPFTGAIALLGHWANSTGGSGATHISRPTANLTTFQITMSMRAWAAANGTKGKIFREAVADAGFAIPFNVSANGSYHITVNWTVDWNASAKGSGCTASNCTYGLASAGGTVYVVAGYRNGIGRCPFGSVSTHGATVYGSGHLTVSCTAFGYLLKAGQMYKVRTWIQGLVALVADGHRSASGTFVMSGPLHGGTLVSVWVH